MYGCVSTQSGLAVEEAEVVRRRERRVVARGSLRYSADVRVERACVVHVPLMRPKPSTSNPSSVSARADERAADARCRRSRSRAGDARRPSGSGRGSRRAGRERRRRACTRRRSSCRRAGAARVEPALVGGRGSRDRFVDHRRERRAAVRRGLDERVVAVELDVLADDRRDRRPPAPGVGTRHRSVQVVAHAARPEPRAARLRGRARRDGRPSLSGSTTKRAWPCLGRCVVRAELELPCRRPDARRRTSRPRTWRSRASRAGTSPTRPGRPGASPIPSGPPSPMFAPQDMSVQNAVLFSAPPVFPEVS